MFKQKLAFCANDGIVLHNFSHLDITRNRTVHKMRIRTLFARNFRSIAEVNLTDCGSFNVLIGKNNSGKSTILSCLNGFFSTISTDGLVSMSPAFGRRIDFHKDTWPAAIEVAVTFTLSDAERDSLVDSIVQEAPQLKNAAEALPSPIQMTARLRVAMNTQVYSYVSDIYLEEVVTSSESRPSRFTLLSMSEETAIELVDVRKKLRRISQVVETLNSVSQRMDQDDWERFRGEVNERRASRNEGSGPPLRFFLRHYAPDGPYTEEAATMLTKLLREEKTYPDFQRSIESLVAGQSDERELLRRELLTHPLETFSGKDATIPAYVAEVIQRIGKMRVQFLTDRRDPIGKAEAERLLNLKVRRGGNEELENIQETVSSLLGVSIDAFQGDNTPGAARVAELDVDEFLVEANGSGIREALRLILDVEFSQPGVILVEEPEMHLHPGLETSMMRYLKRKSIDCQVFLTTHSTNFLDTADMRNVYLVSKPKETAVRKVTFDEAESQIPKELGIKLSSLFMFDRLVFVEGASDEGIIRECAATLGINLSQSNVGFVHLGGSRNFLYFATQETLAFLQRRGVAMWFVLDRDERDAVEVTGLQAQLGERARVCVLKRRELENYLANPRALADFVGLKRRLSGSSPQLEPANELIVTNALNSAAEELRSFAIQKRIARLTNRPAYPQFAPTREAVEEGLLNVQVQDQLDRAIAKMQDVKNRVATLIADERTRMEHEWAVHKLEIVPGDELLDVACKKLGTRFQKMRDGVRLASLLRREEIPLEIVG